MSISLQKGQKVNLSKDNAGLSSVIVGLGWDEAPQKGGFFSPKPKPIDCDASAIMLKNGKLAAKEDLVYYATLTIYQVQYYTREITLQVLEMVMMNRLLLTLHVCLLNMTEL